MLCRAIRIYRRFLNKTALFCTHKTNDSKKTEIQEKVFKAAMYCHTHILDSLTGKVDPHAKNVCGFSAFQIASMLGHYEFTDQLRLRHDPNIDTNDQNRLGLAPISEAGQENHVISMDILNSQDIDYD